MNIMPDRSEAVRDPRLPAVLTAMHDYNLTESNAWSELQSLANKVYLDDLDVDPVGVVFDDAHSFRGLMSIYVVLEYGSGEDTLQTAESFRGQFTGAIASDNTASIENVTVDVSPFFEGETA